MGGSLRLTYLGHATVMIELDGIRILTDPVFGDRVGPLRRRGPTPDPDRIGAVDGVVISHAHRDHFDADSLRAVLGQPLVAVPHGLGESAAEVGHRVHELSVNDNIDIAGIRVSAVPARHGRWPLHGGARPIGFLIQGSSSIYFAGDTALYPGMAGLAGHVDVALLPVGRWGPPRGPVRLDASTAIDAAMRVRADVVVPIHWGTFYVPGFRTGRWGWGSVNAGEAFAAEAATRAPELEVRLLQPGESTNVESAG